MSSSIQQIFSDFNLPFLEKIKPCSTVVKVLNRIISCRTPARGGFVQICDSCSEPVVHFHSCRDRHCPVCQGANSSRWAERQMDNALPVNYYHVVFTLPDSLNSTFLANKEAVADCLFSAASQALLKLCKDTKFLGATPAITAVLHTWGQTLHLHPHLHLIVSAGGLANGRFVMPKNKRFLVPIKPLSLIYRGIFLKLLTAKLSLEKELIDTLYQTNFSINIKDPFDSPANIVKYLARYAYRIAISDSRIVDYNKTAETVSFSYKDNKDGGKRKVMTLNVLEFMRRFFLHVLPKGYMKIRYYGLMACRHRKAHILQAKLLLALLGYISSVSFLKSAQPNVCPKCGGNLGYPILFDHLTAHLLC